jgi:hypothetical protein
MLIAFASVKKKGVIRVMKETHFSLHTLLYYFIYVFIFLVYWDLNSGTPATYTGTLPFQSLLYSSSVLGIF